MKKIIISLTLLITIFSYSQNSKIKFGLQTGLNYSNFRGYTIPAEFDPYYSESPGFAYLGGINMEYQIKEKLSLKIELNFERKSQKADNTIELRQNFDEPSQIYNFVTKRNYDYLVLPILLKYCFEDKNSFYINGGSFIGYLLKSQFTNNLNAPGIDSSSLNTTKDNKKIDFGLSLGLGKNIDLSNNKTFSIEIRENLGLTKTSKLDVWNGGNVKTNSLNLIIGYTLN